MIKVAIENLKNKWYVNKIAKHFKKFLQWNKVTNEIQGLNIIYFTIEKNKEKPESDI